MLIRRKTGFTLVEIMVVVLIMAVLVAVAVPNLLRTRITSNEAAAISTVKLMVAGLNNFYTVNQASGGFPATLAGLAPSGQVPYIDPILAVASPTRYGYNYTYTPAAAAGGTVHRFHIYAAPVTFGTTGIRCIYADESAIIYATDLANRGIVADPGPMAQSGADPDGAGGPVWGEID
jgi:prepilin-type N-terminal cleavage/methylation domain-containing protein